MLCAREVKAIAVGVPIGMFTKDELISAWANYIITSIADVPTLIERLNKTLQQ
jgi:phosphoglycolate phosphatase-like HAD superfamily hydrolase